jgi:integrase/recombinase XerD
MWSSRLWRGSVQAVAFGLLRWHEGVEELGIIRWIVEGFSFGTNHKRGPIMVKARHVHVRGPLAPYVAGFERDLVGQGYRSTAEHLYVMAQVSRWLETKDLAARDLTAALVEKFACWRKADGYVSSLSAPKMTALLTYLVDIGVVPAFEAAVAVTPVEVLMGRYTRYLLQERGLSTSSIRHYVDVAHAFLAWLPTDGELELEALTTATVTGFVLAQCRRSKVASAKAMTTRLRSLLRFFYLDGFTPIALAPAVPTVASWRQGSLPKALTAPDVARLLKSCDRRTTVGRRDFAVLVVLSRLGLRAGEVAGLRLGDIDWRQGDLVVRGKANRQDRLPVPGDVGEAIVGWLQRGRPRCGCQSVFTRPGTRPTPCTIQ